MTHPKVIPIRMPNPYFEKDNNAYLLEAGELILIDTGIDTPEAYETLQQSFSDHKYRFGDLSKILLTHKHLDHFGLTHRLLAQSEAEVFIHRDDRLDVTEFEERDELITSLYEKKLHEWGVPQQIVDMLSMRSLLLNLGRSIPAKPLDDGGVVNVGDTAIEVIHTPGHTQGSVCYRLGDWLFTGDHILPTYTPNIGATDVTSEKMLGKFRESLLKIRDLDVATVYPGHGEPFVELSGRIDSILHHHDERDERVLAILSEHEQLNVYEIALKLFGDLKEHHVLLGAGEVQAHLEMLLDKGLVERDSQERYSSAYAASDR